MKKKNLKLEQLKCNYMYIKNHTTITGDYILQNIKSCLLMTSFRQIDREIKKLIFLRIQHAPRHSSTISARITRSLVSHAELKTKASEKLPPWVERKVQSL